MADWTEVPDSVLEVDKPIRSIDITALRDNDKAIVEGKACGTSGYGIGRNKLASGVIASAQAVLDIPMTSYTAYKNKVIKLHLLPATDAAELLMRFSTDGGSTFAAGASDYGTEYSAGGTTTAANGTNILVSAGGAIGNVAAEGWSGEVHLFETTDATKWTRATFFASQVDSTAGQVTRNAHGSGSRRAAQDTDAVRFLFSSGNIASGSWTLYGEN